MPVRFEEIEESSPAPIKVKVSKLRQKGAKDTNVCVGGNEI